jgi:error-prone DNA polymerase
LTLEQEVQLDLATQDLSARPHLLTFQRKALRTAGFVTLAQLKQVKTGWRVCVAGLVISAQRPPTAKGMGFIVLEDETGRVQVALPPPLAETLRPALAESRILAVAGRVERSAGHITLLATRLQPYMWVDRKNTIRARQQGNTPSRVRGVLFDQRLVVNSAAPEPVSQVAKADFS